MVLLDWQKVARHILTRDRFAGEGREVKINAMTRRGLCHVLLAMISLVGCDRKSGSGGPPPPGAKPGHLTGKLSDAQGRPLSNVTVSIFGFSDKGEPVRREAKVAGPAGEYDIPLPDGKYDTPTARIDIDYNGRSYSLPLAATDGTREWAQQKEPKDGIVRDFIWKISGRAPGGADESPRSYWGGTILFDKAGDLGDGATIEIILTPEGPLIDGSPGQTLTFTRKLPWKRQDEHLLLDIPIGKYKATARKMFGSNPKPLRLVAYTIDPAASDSPPPSPVQIATVEFECREVKPGEFQLIVPNLIVFAP
jgi:hypothetical protein